MPPIHVPHVKLEFRQFFADVVWSIFSGISVWEESKKALDPTKHYMKKTLDRAFDLLIKGIKK